MAGSADEQAIRAAAVAHLRAARPRARIIHELNISDCRADLVLVEEEVITTVEIKSGKDTLDRLDRQAQVFRAHSHHMIVIADQRWFETFNYDRGGQGYRPVAGLAAVRTTGFSLWHWPVLKKRYEHDHQAYPWDMPRPTRRQPPAAKLLDLLWVSELQRQALVAGVQFGLRDPKDKLIDRMVWEMTGAQIFRAACAELRAREFRTEADAPIPLNNERTE